MTTDELIGILTAQSEALRALGKLVEAVDSRVTLLTLMLNRQDDALIKLGALPPRPTGGDRAN